MFVVLSDLIAYELSSSYWGRGLAHEATECVMAELAGPYRVHRMIAVLKATNHRSRRLLERLGLRIASAQTQTQTIEDIGADELLMARIGDNTSAIRNNRRQPRLRHGPGR